MGLGLGLDWKELIGWPLPWPLPPHWSREVRQHKEGQLALAPWGSSGKVQGNVSGYLHLKPVGLCPLHWVERKVLVLPPTMTKATSSVPWPALPICVLSLIPCFPPQGRMPTGVEERLQAA